MSLSALAFVGVFFLGLYLAFTKHPIFATYSYLWAFYNAPATRWWGSALPDLRWSLVAALVMLITTLQLKPLGTTPNWYRNGAAYTLTVFVGWLWLQNIWALDSDAQWFLSILFTKYVLLFYCIYRITADSEEHFELFIWANIIGCFIWGWNAFTTVSSGRLENIGGQDVAGANGASLQLVIGLAFAGFLFMAARGTKRWISFAVIPFVLNAIIVAGSRGAFLGMIAAGAAGLYLAPGRHRLYSAGAIGLAAILLWFLANDLFWERMATLKTTDETSMETSARSRLDIARADWRMFLDYPMGIGHGGNERLSSQYVPEEFLAETGTRSAHSTVMAVLVDHGSPGIVLFVLLLVWIVFKILSLKSLDRLGIPRSLAIYRAALGSAFAACLVCGLFTNFIKAEVQIWLVAMMVALHNLCLESLCEGRRNSVVEGNAQAAFRKPGKLFPIVKATEPT